MQLLPYLRAWTDLQSAFVWLGTLQYKIPVWNTDVVDYRSYGQTFRNAFFSPIKLRPRWFPFATQFHEETGRVGLRDMSHKPKPSPPDTSPLGCRGPVTGRRHSGHAQGDGQWAVLLVGTCLSREGCEGAGSDASWRGQWWFSFPLPFPQQPVISTEPLASLSCGASSRGYPKKRL